MLKGVKRMDGLTNFIDKLKYFEDTLGTELIVEAGILSNIKYEDGNTVAEVATMQEYGTERIPARPFMRPTIETNKQKYTDLVSNWINQGLDRETIGSRLSLTLAGDIKESISNVFTPTLAKLTLANRKTRGNQSSKPLVDTGILIGSISGSYK